MSRCNSEVKWYTPLHATIQAHATHPYSQNHPLPTGSRESEDVDSRPLISMFMLMFHAEDESRNAAAPRLVR